MEGEGLLPPLRFSGAIYKSGLSLLVLGGRGTACVNSQQVTASVLNYFVKLSVCLQHVVHIKWFAGLVPVCPSRLEWYFCCSHVA